MSGKILDDPGFISPLLAEYYSGYTRKGLTELADRGLIDTLPVNREQKSEQVLFFSCYSILQLRRNRHPEAIKYLTSLGTL